MNRSLISQSAGILIFTLIATCMSGIASAQVSSFCWKDSYGRGVGTIPDKCPAGKIKEGALCYNPCPAGYASSAWGACIQTCPAGMRDDGAFCRKAEVHIEEFPWQFGDPLNDTRMFQRCEAKHGKGRCEKQALVVVNKCKPGYTHVAGVCRPNQEPNCAALGMGDKVAGLSCTKKSILKSPVTANCGANQEYDAGLCYSKCKYKMVGVGPVCWDKCANTPLKFECAAGCTKDEATCATETTNMVVSVLDSAASIATTIGTLGAAAGIKAGAKMSAKQAVKAAGKSTGLKTFKKGFKSIGKAGKGVVSEVVKEQFKGQIVKQGWDAATGYPQAALGAAGSTINMFSSVDGIINEPISDAEKDFLIAQNVLNTTAMFEPFGIVGVAAAFTKPLCSILSGKPAPPESNGKAGFSEQGIQTEEQYANIKRALLAMSNVVLEEKQAATKIARLRMDGHKQAISQPLMVQTAVYEQLISKLSPKVEYALSFAVTAALHSDDGRSYLFYNNGTYARFSSNGEKIDSGYPQPIRKGGFVGQIPDRWIDANGVSVDAAFPNFDTNIAYFFRNNGTLGSQYIRLKDYKLDAGYPQSFPGGWQNMPRHWDGIDAGVFSKESNALFLFRGDEYVKISRNGSPAVEKGYPRKIKDSFKGIPWNLSGDTLHDPGIDAALAKKGKLYFFRGLEYVRMPDAVGKRRVEAGYPKAIVGPWQIGDPKKVQEAKWFLQHYVDTTKRLLTLKTKLAAIRKHGGSTAYEKEQYRALLAEWEKAKSEESQAYQLKQQQETAAKPDAIRTGWRELQNSQYSCVEDNAKPALINTEFFYRVENRWGKTSGQVLDFNSDSLAIMEGKSPSGSYQLGAHWQFTPVPKRPGVYWMSTQWKEFTHRLAMVDIAGDSEALKLLPANDSDPKQMWRITTHPSISGHVSLTNEARGRCGVVDVMPDAKNVRLRNGSDSVGQAWQLVNTKQRAVCQGGGLHVGDTIRLVNAYENGTGGYLDTNSKSARSGAHLEVSTTRSLSRDQRYSTSTWVVKSAGGKPRCTPLKFGDQIRLLNAYAGFSGGYLDVNSSEDRGKAGAYLDVTTHGSPDRASAGTATWRLLSSSGNQVGRPVSGNDLVHLANQYTNGKGPSGAKGGYLDTNHRSDKSGAHLDVSTTMNLDRDRGFDTSTWKLELLRK